MSTKLITGVLTSTAMGGWLEAMNLTNMPTTVRRRVARNTEATPMDTVTRSADSTSSKTSVRACTLEQGRIQGSRATSRLCQKTPIIYLLED